jgi:hypothetical protein
MRTPGGERVALAIKTARVRALAWRQSYPTR